ncbi:MAG: nucleotidyl transferase AbiEii/AbiGii toxin family protein [Prolixibacteraceae bacterium]|jgi:predicted nucleotidyltransferase component of viral defense system|nr:nucleotidyl transferase AbiEii/AbiGii toxin family protein [Prolixibacteraceae bacterium]MBT6763214.1 nucleotidyl transferase AbiEii/AbiGii toxin family protein [Prolixibacteraceae bacterium]MBT6998294.1 nucleotidyl transferase AbiEii/AbiGii toxin family protein [Prolixibacteraceae bacterium]MBT7396460.1 nucleotidyl transferase AbiEii/AbiGii toxin family protein [Prolixibacteraceae bacterium]
MEKNELSVYKSKLNYNLGQLELDYYQHLILSKIFEKYNTIYFKGGTCLQKCYGIKRFSEDLDFNYIDIEMNEIIGFIESIFDAKINNYYETKFGVSFSIRFEGILFNGTNLSKCKMSFDFRDRDIYNKPLKNVIRPIYHDLPNYFLLALDKEEILAEKIRAILTRYKARDVYDLNELLLNEVEVDFELVNKKLQTYKLIFNRDEFAEKLEEKRTIFDEEMKRLTNIFDDFETCKKRILKQVNLS